VDRQFECIIKYMEATGINLNTTALDEHIPEIERYIQTVKERIRETTSTLPFKQLPHHLIVEIAYNAVFWLNCFPHKEGTHSTLSPHTIVTGSKIYFNKHCRLQFGTYLQMHEQHNNSLLPRMAGAIALHPTGNEQGSYYFLSLHTGKRVVKNKWTVLPMPAKVIATIHQLAAACKKYNGITFTDIDGNIIRDSDNEDDAAGNLSDNTRVNSEVTGVDGDDNETSQITGVPQINLEGNSHDPEGNSHENEGNIDCNDEPNDKGNKNSPPKDESFSNQQESNTNDSEENSPGNTHTTDNDEIFIKNRSPEDPRVTINNINIIEEMNTAQINNNNTNEEAIENYHEWTTVANNNRYNLRPRPANRGNMYTLLQNNQQSANVAIPKLHAQVMLTQMNV